MVPQCQAPVMVLDAEEALPGTLLLELPVPTQVHVVTRVDRVLVVTELQGKQSILAPWHVGVELDLVASFGEMSVTLSAEGSHVYLTDNKSKQNVIHKT